MKHLPQTSSSNRKYFLIGATLALLMFSIVNKADENRDSQRLKHLIDQIDAIRTNYNVPAVGLSIVKNNTIVWEGSLGVSDRERDVKADKSTTYRVGSITKTFTALAILKLQEERKLMLSDPIRRYLQESNLDNPWAMESPITLANLLEHTAGLPDIGTAEFAHEDSSPISISDGLAFNGEYHKVMWKPGLHSSYSNLGAGIAALAIEQVAGLSFDDYLNSILLPGLGMDDSSTLLTNSIRNSLAKGYSSNGQREIAYWHVILRPFGSLNSSPRDMSKLLLLLVNRGWLNNRKIFSTSSIERMETPKTTLASKAGLKYGYGLGNYQTEHRGFLFHGHGGTASGYLARFDYHIKSKSGYATMINSSNSSALREINYIIKDYLVDDLSKPVVAKDMALPAEINEYLGFYQPITSRSRVALFLQSILGIKKIERNSKALNFISVFSSPELLTHVGQNHYRSNEKFLANAILLKGKNSIIYFQNEQNYKKISSLSFYFKMSILALTLIFIVYSFIYFLGLMAKLSYLRKWPDKIQIQNLVLLLPFYSTLGLIFVLIVHSPYKQSISSYFFEAFGIVILTSSIINLLILFKNKNQILSIKSLQVFVGLVLSYHLFTSTLISQPIWS